MRSEAWQSPAESVGRPVFFSCPEFSNAYHGVVVSVSKVTFYRGG